MNSAKLIRTSSALLLAASLSACGGSGGDDAGFTQPPPGDTTPPVLTAGAPTGTLSAGTTQADLSAQTDESATCRYGTTANTAYSSMSDTFSTTGGTAHSETLTGLVDGQSYEYFVRCSDGAGNANTSDYSIQFSIGSVADTTPPVLSVGAPTGTLASGTTEADLLVQTDEAATCRYDTNSGTAYASMADTFSTTGGTGHSQRLTGLVDGQSYQYFVRCSDTAGNANTSDFTIDFAIDDMPDTTAPQRSAGSPSGTLPAGTRNTNVSLATDEAATCRYSTTADVAYSAMTSTFGTTGGTSHSEPVSGLMDGQSYDYFVRCIDVASNANTSDFPISFSVDAVADTTPPTRQSPRPEGVLSAGTTSTTIGLDTDEVATCAYGTVAGTAYADLTESFNSTDGLAHDVDVFGLSDGELYTYFARCQDGAGNANPDDFTIEFSVATASSGPTVSDNFDGNGPLLDYVTNNPNAIPDVARVNGRYNAPILDNTGDITLHFNDSQGRLDAKLVSFPFEYIARNVGIGTEADSQVPPDPSGDPYMFAGIQVHVLDLESRNSSHLVVGHRGPTHFTVEGKNTVDSVSRQNDDGANVLPNGRGDLRVVGRADRTLRWYWQTPNPDPGVVADSWIAYGGDGILRIPEPSYGPEVYIGLISYAFLEASVPFVGTADSVELVGE